MLCYAMSKTSPRSSVRCCDAASKMERVAFSGHGLAAISAAVGTSDASTAASSTTAARRASVPAAAVAPSVTGSDACATAHSIA